MNIIKFIVIYVNFWKQIGRIFNGFNKIILFNKHIVAISIVKKDNYFLGIFIQLSSINLSRCKKKIIYYVKVILWFIKNILTWRINENKWKSLIRFSPISNAGRSAFTKPSVKGHLLRSSSGQHPSTSFQLPADLKILGFYISLAHQCLI